LADYTNSTFEWDNWKGHGEAGLAMLSRNAVDVSVLDLGLPGIGGLDVLKKLRDGEASIPVIVLLRVSTPRCAIAFNRMARTGIQERRSQRRSDSPHRDGARAGGETDATRI
jgi:DNA-binding NarL/FixJ family response regulator